MARKKSEPNNEAPPRATQSTLESEAPTLELSAEENLRELRTLEATIEALDRKIEAKKEDLKELKGARESAVFEMRRRVRESQQGQLFVNSTTGEVVDTEKN